MMRILDARGMGARVCDVALVWMLCSACSGSSKARVDCAPQAWTGTCTLRSVKKIEDRALPIPYVVYEAVYTPVPAGDANTPSYTPPEVRMNFGALAEYEVALTDHIAQQKTVACHVPTKAGTCVPENTVADVVPFDPARVHTEAVARKTGCEAIEATSEQDRLGRVEGAKILIPERLMFAADSSSLSPEATALASSVASRLKEDATLECVGVVGQISAGESPSLGESRAHAVKELLVSLGVERSRLITIATTSNVFGSGAKPREADPKDRRVALSVLLQQSSPKP